MTSQAAHSTNKANLAITIETAPRPISRTLTIRRALPAALANIPSAASFTHSTLIASQPSPVPGAILSAPELLDPVAIAQKKTTRSQPSGLKFRLQLGGMKEKGGEGKYNNAVELGPREFPRPIETEVSGEDEEMQDGEGVAEEKDGGEESEEGEETKGEGRRWRREISKEEEGEG